MRAPQLAYVTAGHVTGLKHPFWWCTFSQPIRALFLANQDLPDNRLQSSYAIEALYKQRLILFQ